MGLENQAGQIALQFSLGRFSSYTQSPRQAVSNRTGIDRFVQTMTRPTFSSRETDSSQDQLVKRDPLREHPPILLDNSKPTFERGTRPCHPSRLTGVLFRGPFPSELGAEGTITSTKNESEKLINFRLSVEGHITPQETVERSVFLA